MTRTTILGSIAATVLASAVLAGPAAAGDSTVSTDHSFSYSYTASSPQEALMLKSAMQNYVGQASGGAIIQSGVHNAAGLSQNGSGNLGIIAQTGNGNTGTLTQNGNNNAYMLYQVGNGGNAAVTQTGDNQAGFSVQANW